MVIGAILLVMALSLCFVKSVELRQKLATAYMVIWSLLTLSSAVDGAYLQAAIYAAIVLVFFVWRRKLNEQS